MSKIIPHLNLNKTPQLVDSNSLIYAQNIKLLKDNTIGRDDGISSILDTSTYGHIVGVISYNTKFYVFCNDYTTSDDIITIGDNNTIIEYNEKTKETNTIPTAWHWSGGDIKGNVVVNLNGDIILNIAEYPNENFKDILVPFKSINITESSSSDDESIYTQTPDVPFINLNYIGKYANPIPNGVYQFFIRYKIKENFYTSWFPCSKELYTGYKKTIEKSVIGTVSYIDTTTNSDESFYFSVDKIRNSNTNYESFQLGFLLSTDDKVIGRSWKHFTLDTDVIYFDCNNLSDFEEVDVVDFTSSLFALYNVRNLTNFKNKEYVSNYVETNFNPVFEEGSEIKTCVEGIQVSLQSAANSDIDSGYIFEEGDDILSDYWVGINYNTVKSIIRSLTDKVNETYLNKPNSSSHPTELIHGIQVNVETDEATSTISKPSWVPEGASYASALSYLDGNGDYIKWNEYSVADKEFIDCISKSTSNFYNSTEVDTLDPIPLRNSLVLYFVREVDNEWKGYVLKLTFQLVATPTSISTIKDVSSLVPFQEYKFYIHYVKSNGETTNGYYIGSIVESDYNSFIQDIKDHNILYPKFENITYPTGYVTCFITIQHHKNKIFEIFNVEVDGNGKFRDPDIPSANNVYVGDCLELDTLLVPVDKFGAITLDNGNIIDYSETFEKSLVYRESSYVDNFGAFGNVGKVIIDSVGYDRSFIFGKLKTTNDAEDVKLIKCTPYIIGNSYDNYSQLNLTGFVVSVQKPTLKEPTYYISSSKIYNKVKDDSYFRLDELSALNNYKAVGSDVFQIYSNYNLAYLSLSNGITIEDGIYSKQITDGGTPRNLNIYMKYVESQLLSSIFDLPAMYKDYTKKTYSKYEEYTQNTFNNTIRSSKLKGDESKVYLFDFAPADYYNVPTDKGSITNLVAVGNVILVHTNDSLYRFSGSNTLVASGGEDIQTQETDVFDSGIAELFGSEKGYGGLQDNQCTLINQIGYYWYDHDSNILYSYTDTDKVKAISDSISKLFNTSRIRDINFANDYYNDRIFINIAFIVENQELNTYVTLSYNLKTNNFISLHTFDFDKSFSTKCKPYFINNDKIYTIDSESYSYGDLRKRFADYPVFEYPISDEEIPQTEDYSVVDVIYKEQYETIKTVNSVKWICSKINTFGVDSYNLAEEELNRQYAGDLLRIYTDSCDTGELNISSRSNDNAIKPAGGYITGATEFYTKPRYNLGMWFINYFRNIENTNGQTDSDNKSLIYGKYVVVRFLFKRDNNFKLENVSLNLTNNNSI